MKNILSKIDDLKKQWDALQPLKKEHEETLWAKFRLEWNYNSNHIEGNTLTYGDTELLLRLGDDFRAQNNSLKDVNEMKAHDLAINMIREWTRLNERSLLEKDIRELNQTILVKDYWSDAQTSDGQSTRRLIKVGDYKEQPNHVLLRSGETFRYAEPQEVPAKMQELLEWYNSSEDVHPLIVAAFFHYKFVLIHPFDDGNGRVSRLLMNYHLMRQGYPPVIIKSSDKENYLYALRQADGGDTDAFVKYIGEQLVWSLDIAIKAANGESIEEQDDLDKEMALWEKKQDSLIPSSSPRRNDLIVRIIEETIKNIYHQIWHKCGRFEKYYKESSCLVKIQLFKEQSSRLFSVFPLYKYKANKGDTIRQIFMDITFSNPLLEEKEFNSVELSVKIEFKQFQYDFFVDGVDQKLSKNYDEIYSETESKEMIKTAVKTLFQKIKTT